MPLDETQREAVEMWLKDARADFAVAIAPLPPGAMYKILCYHAQQAVEKAIKAVFIALDTEFPFSHEIKELLRRLPAEAGQPPEAQAVSELTTYAVETRYPAADADPVTVDDRAEAVRLARRVLEWADDVITKELS